MLHFIYSNGFLTRGGEEFYCSFSISGVVKGKIVHFVIKVSKFAQTFLTKVDSVWNWCPKFWLPPDDIIVVSFGPKGPKNKSYQITFTLI